MRGALSLLLGAVSVSAIRDPTDKPNIVMFFVDDLGYGDMGFTGHPSTKTPNFDKMAYNGKILSSWYSGCPVCSGSRSALMTGRQYVRLGVPGVFSQTVADGLNLNETVVGKQLKKAGYKTAAMGKWHLGQRNVYLPGSRGFDRYLGIPYSDDMGKATTSSCNAEDTHVNVLGKSIADGENTWDQYVEAGHARKGELSNDPAGSFLPLVHQIDGNTTVLEQPLDFTTLAIKYNAYVLDVIEDFQADPFFLYMPFSHVHTTATNQPEMQYAGCAFKNSTTRGMFGDALAEADWIAGNVLAKLEQLQLEKNTLILFSSDNGPWMARGKSGGSPGIHYGRASGYWNVGKGSTWEGGIHMPAFAYWPDMIEAGTRTTEVVSSLDLFPTASALAGVDLPENVFYDGRDMTDVLLKQDGKSKHEFLFFYNTGISGAETKCGRKGPTAVRYGRYKAHFETEPGLAGCTGCTTQCYDPMLLFDVLEDPSEAYPLALNSTPAAYANVINEIIAARDAEAKTMYYGKLTAAPDGPGEGPGTYGVCCDRTLGCNCTAPPSKW